MMGCNDAYRLCDTLDVLYAADCEWIKLHHKHTHQIRWRYTACPDEERRHDWRYLPVVPKPGLSTNPGYTHSGNNSGYQLVNLATLMGHRRIVLIGYDMQLGRKGKRHWFGDHPKPLANNAPYVPWVQNYRSIPASLPGIGASIVNASEQTAIDCFPRMSNMEAAQWLVT